MTSDQTAPPEPMFRSWVDPLTNSEYQVRHCYTDAMGGKWYEFTEPLRMPTARGLEGEFAAEWARMQLTPEDLLAYLATMKEQGKAGMVVDMFHTIGKLEDRVKAMADKKSLRELAKVYFVLEDEPIGWCTPTANEAKDRRWAEDPAAEGFFLRMAFVYTHGYSDVSGIDILSYLRAWELMHMMTPKPLSEQQPSDVKKTGVSSQRKSFAEGLKRSTRKRT